MSDTTALLSFWQDKPFACTVFFLVGVWLSLLCVICGVVLLSVNVLIVSLITPPCKWRWPYPVIFRSESSGRLHSVRKNTSKVWQHFSKPLVMMHKSQTQNGVNSSCGIIPPPRRPGDPLSLSLSGEL